MRQLLLLMILLVSISAAAQKLVAETQDPIIVNGEYCLDKPSNSQVPYAEVRVYTLGGLDVDKLYIQKDGRLLKITKTPAYQSLFFMCDGTVTSLTMSASGYGSLDFMFDSRDGEGNISPGYVYKLEIRATAAPPPPAIIHDIFYGQYIENLSHQKAKQGQTVTFEVEDRPGYKFDYVMIGDKKIERKMSQYSFSMPGNEIHIMAHFTKTGNRVEVESEVTQPPATTGADLNFTVSGVTFKMKYVLGGTFRMGSDASDADSDEKPVHTVTLSDYYIGETEVTCGLWKAVMGSDPSNFKKGDNYPVENVSWDDSQEFIKKLNQKTGRTFRLPTEAEWEYAARGGSKSRGYKYSGSNNLSDVAWYGWGDNNDKNRTITTKTTMPVKTKSPNELGLYDMSGNVYEWCSDGYESSYYVISPSTNPQGPSPQSVRVLRGGSWYFHARICRVSYRSRSTPFYRDFNFGLRLALVP